MGVGCHYESSVPQVVCESQVGKGFGGKNAVLLRLPVMRYQGICSVDVLRGGSRVMFDGMGSCHLMGLEVILLFCCYKKEFMDWESGKRRRKNLAMKGALKVDGGGTWSGLWRGRSWSRVVRRGVANRVGSQGR